MRKKAISLLLTGLILDSSMGSALAEGKSPPGRCHGNRQGQTKCGGVEDMSIDNILDYSDGSQNGISDFLGVTHINPQYGFDGEDCIVEGAERLLELGTKSVKVYLSPNYRDYYSHDIDWGDYDSPVELVQSPSFTQLLDMDFNTYFIGTYVFSEEQYATYWRQGLTKAQKRAEYRALYDLTYYLCMEYSDSGKTFILQNWEGDWSTMEVPSPATDPDDAVYQRMIEWVNIRQDAVNDARRNAARRGAKQVRVYHALEVNLVGKALQGGKTVTNNVIPHTYCDYYSYSAYDTELQPQLYSQALDYLKEKAAQNLIPGRSRVFVGEFGLPQNEFGSAKVEKTIDDVTTISREKGIDYVIYWQLYDNEVYDASVPAGEQTDANCRGYWLIKPSGAKTIAWNYFYKLIHGVDDPEYVPEPPSIYDYLEITLGVINQSRGLTQPNATDGMSTAMEFQGKTCHMSPGDSVNHFNYMYFKADDDYITPADSHVLIEFTYFDRGSAPLVLEYFNTAGVLSSRTLTRTGTETWKTASFRLSDAQFDNLFHGGFADFRFNDYGSSIYMHYLKVQKWTPEGEDCRLTAGENGDTSEGLSAVVLGDITGGAYLRGEAAQRYYIAAQPGEHLRFDLEGQLEAAPGNPVKVEVEYYDGESEGGFVLYYTDGSESVVISTPAVMFTGTGQWLSHTFVLTDAVFDNLWYGLADFSVYSGGKSVPVHSVRVFTEPPQRTSVSILLRAAPIEEGISLKQLGYDGSTVAGVMGGQDCLGTDEEANQSPDKTNNYIYFDADDTVVTAAMEELWVEVTYFDLGTAPFELQYNSTLPDDPPAYLGLATPYAMTRTGTNEWVTQTIHITDAQFANKLQGGFADFRFNDKGEQLWLSRVAVHTEDPSLS